MSIQFTQYLLPHGRKTDITIDRSDEIEALAKKFIEAGGWFEAEILTNSKVSLTACWRIDNEPQDIFYEIVDNGPEIPEAVDRLVKKSSEWEVSRDVH